YEASDSIEKTVYRRFISRRDNDEVYARRYDTYKKLYPQLKDLYRSNY
ncbi:MAG: hypothetical protein HFI18_02495, partial [Lachnospiraceae bacterium]|nr:hypothetical protein [Lachnospiraceae bacterium]